VLIQNEIFDELSKSNILCMQCESLGGSTTVIATFSSICYVAAKVVFICHWLISLPVRISVEMFVINHPCYRTPSTNRINDIGV